MIDDKLRTAARATLTEYLKAKRLRKTPERYAILDKVCEMNKHFDIEALYAAIEGDGYHVSRATIYNTMELLSDCGIVRRHQFGAQPAQCGKIKEVKDPELVSFMNSRRYSAFHDSYFCLYVYGICAACTRRNRREAGK